MSGTVSSLPPASSKSTEVAGSSVKRFASTQPAEPAPTIYSHTSFFLLSCLVTTTMQRKERAPFFFHTSLVCYKYRRMLWRSQWPSARKSPLTSLCLPADSQTPTERGREVRHWPANLLS